MRLLISGSWVRAPRWAPMHRSPEVLRIPPVEPTPVHGCFKDHTENHQDFPKLETLCTRQNSTTKLPLLPHYLVLSNKGMSKYQPLNISEFVCGYIEMVRLYPQIQDDLYGHLQLLMGKAMTYSWNSVKIFHLDGTCNHWKRPVLERDHSLTHGITLADIYVPNSVLEFNTN